MCPILAASDSSKRTMWDHVYFTIAAEDCDTFSAHFDYGLHMKTVRSHIFNAPSSVAHQRRYIPVQVAVRRPQLHTFRKIALRGAYALLAVITIWTLILDHLKRRNVASSPLLNSNAASVRSDPFAITRLADSPFLKKSNPSSVAVVSPVLEKSKQGANRLDANGGNRG